MYILHIYTLPVYVTMTIILCDLKNLQSKCKKVSIVYQLQMFKRTEETYCVTYRDKLFIKKVTCYHGFIIWCD